MAWLNNCNYRDVASESFIATSIVAAITHLIFASIQTKATSNLHQHLNGTEQCNYDTCVRMFVEKFATANEIEKYRFRMR